jgi:hypothetical protein
MVPALGNTHKKILSQFKNCQTDHLHFKNLIPVKKTIACTEVAATPCRGFVAISNKQNILRYKNPRLPSSNKQWLYWFLTRILLERVTEYCARHARSSGITDAKVRLVFSRRGGNDYDHFKEYLELIRGQSQAGDLYLRQGDIAWDVIDFDEVHVIDSVNSTGLQLADVICGAFFNAVNIGSRSNDPSYAKILKPIMAKDLRGDRLYYSVKPMPKLASITLNASQTDFFNFYRIRS